MSEDLETGKKLNSIHMQSDKIDQININHQSNMALSAHSTITQSYYSINVNDGITGEGIESHD